MNCFNQSECVPLSIFCLRKYTISISLHCEFLDKVFLYRLAKLKACRSSVLVSVILDEIAQLIIRYCLVSNEVPEQPVLSPVSGCIYEKRLIIKYLQDSRTDPVTGQPLTEDQLIDVKGIELVYNFAMNRMKFH